jgi:hypothetical protein
MQTNFHLLRPLRQISIMAIASVLFLFSACTEETTTDDCSISINSFSLSTTNFAAGATLTGSIAFVDKVGLDALTARSVTELYLSSDNTYSSNDTQLDAFTNTPTLSGSTYTVAFNQIDIPFGISSGSYYIIARIPAQSCGGGISSTAVSNSKSVTVN